MFVGGDVNFLYRSLIRVKYSIANFGFYIVTWLIILIRKLIRKEIVRLLVELHNGEINKMGMVVDIL